ncbi:MAG: hypothetical protein NTV00_01500 [Methylococcales bacterium]|nr:hypothetical protein [Methylococcales bacterium]
MLLNKKMLISLTVMVSVLIWMGWLYVASFSKFNTLTYNQDIATIINTRCVSCHRLGEMGPMALQTYQSVKTFISPIEQAIKTKQMPPWHASHTVGEFSNDRSLTDDEYDKLLGWINNDYPEGNGKPPVTTYTKGWQIGVPDIEFTIEKPITIPAQGKMDYQYQIVPTHFSEDKWISAAEIRVAEGGVAHHVIITVVAPENESPVAEPGVDCYQKEVVAKAPKRRVAPKEYVTATLHSEGKYLLGWGVGVQVDKLPEGAAIRIPAGARLLFELHYVPTGTVVVDSTTRIGFTFAKEKVTKEVHTIKASNQTFVIPPREANHEVTACYIFKQPITLLELVPHMHLRGKDFTYIVRYPNGNTETLLFVPHFDFEWQTVYRLAKPRHLPVGARLEAIAHYDNSISNKHNPNPDKEIRFGPQTEDEMMIGLAVVMTDLAK